MAPVQTTDSGWVDTVYRFWFEETKPDQRFRADPVFDRAVKMRFADLYATLSSDPAVVSDPRSTLARVIVLDQFSRNMFRDTPAAFATDPLALAIAHGAIAAGLDRDLSPQERMFLYMPFQHSEDRVTQRRSIELFTALGMPEVLDYAKQHKAIIDRFGRFPHRNAILGRASTPEEQEFLKTAPAFG